MKKLSQIILYAVAIAVLAWFLPWVYALMFPTPSGEPFCSFSPVSNQWVVSRVAPGEKPTIMLYDSIADNRSTGVEITREERDSLVPQLFYKELLAHDNLPDTIAGLEVNAQELRTHELNLNTTARDLVKRNPGVWMMMESMPERVELSDADQVFRFTADNRIEFVDMATNTVNQSRSKRFTETLTNRGFSFPGRELSANVTSRKQYDEGYLMIDNAGKLFHVKQQAGRPYVAAIKMPNDVKAAHVFITEEMNRAILGFVTDIDNNIYLIERDGYAVYHLPIGTVDPTKENILVMGNMFNIAFRFSSDSASHWRAVARDNNGYKCLGSYDFTRERTTAARVADYIFPFTLSYTSNYDSLAYPRIARWSWQALALNILLMLVLVAAYRRSNRNTIIAMAAVTLVCGLYAFIPFMLLRD